MIATLTAERTGIASVRQLDYAVDAEAAFARLFERGPAFWLDSADGARGRWSYLGDASGPHASLHCAPVTSLTSIADFLRGTKTPDTQAPCPFTGGYVGFVGYEARDPGRIARRYADTPDAFFIASDRFIAIDHHEAKTYLLARERFESRERARAWTDSTARELATLVPLAPPRTGTARAVRARFLRGRRAYEDDVRRALEFIGDGESYQICLTGEIVCEAALDEFELYRHLRRRNPATYAAFLRYPGGAVLSASPECFLRVDGAGRVTTKPLKGTIARAETFEADRAAAQRLRESAKDRAENVMIADLLRNDLARVCEIGSVRVPELLKTERFATVHQLVSTVTGVLREDCDVGDLLRATFPGGSMTGAPKIRAMELIDALEQRPRGVYSGALGWIGHDGACELSIVIRTIAARAGLLRIGAGGGIVADSTPQGEFEELLLKARGSLAAIALAASGDAAAQSLSLEGSSDR